MKFKFTFVLLVLIGQFFSLTAREVTSFNEGWLFKRGPFSEDPVKVVAQWEGKWETVNLPHTWNAKDMQVKAASFYEGVGYYKKKQFFNEELKGKRVFLRFEGVGANTEVYVNSKLVGTHKGGYSAFAFEIGTALKFGAENEIMVKADNTARPDVIPVNHSLFGVYGGIYRPVWLIVTEQNNITVTDCASPGVYITQKNVSKRSADITVKVKLDNGMFNGSIRTKSITIIAELCFADWFHDLLDTLLYQPIPYAWDSQRTCFSVWFRDIFPSYRLWSVAVFASRNNKSHSFYHIIRSLTPNICDVLFVCSCRVAAFVRFDVSVRK